MFGTKIAVINGILGIIHTKKRESYFVSDSSRFMIYY